MSEAGVSEARRRRSGLGLAIVALGALGVAAVLYVVFASSLRPGDPGLRQYARGSLARLETGADQTAAPAASFQDPQGRPVRIAALPGEVKVVNLWATWCAPCITEMPTLAALQKAYPGRVSVTPISIDRPADAERARLFIAKHTPLAFHHDPNFALAGALKVQGLPATIIYDAQGRERARLHGSAEWDSPEARKLVDALLDGA